MRSLAPLIPMLLVLGSCGSPPKPPTVDESNKRPANAAMAVALQVCKSDLQNTRIAASESDRRAESAASALQRMARAQAANSLFTVRFEFGSTRVVVPEDIGRALIEEAKAAPLVLLRGRTDGTSDDPADSQIARARAAAVRDYLVAAGVDPAHIRATYQPAGDHVADNASVGGRSLNRRVEIEVYRALPVAVTSVSAPIAAQP